MVLFIDLYVINESRDFREEYRVALMIDKIISLKEATKNRTIISLLGDESYEVKGSVAAIKNKIKNQQGVINNGNDSGRTERKDAGYLQSD